MSSYTISISGNDNDTDLTFGAEGALLDHSHNIVVGPSGIDGIDGRDGIDGIDGIDGLPGPVGPRGPGSSGVPVAWPVYFAPNGPETGCEISDIVPYTRTIITTVYRMVGGIKGLYLAKADLAGTASIVKNINTNTKQALLGPNVMYSEYTVNGATSVAVDPSGTVVAVSQAGDLNQVSFFSVQDLSYLDSSGVGQHPDCVIWSPSGDRVYTADSNDRGSFGKGDGRESGVDMDNMNGWSESSPYAPKNTSKGGCTMIRWSTSTNTIIGRIIAPFTATSSLDYLYKPRQGLLNFKVSLDDSNGPSPMLYGASERGYYTTIPEASGSDIGCYLNAEYVACITNTKIVLGLQVNSALAIADFPEDDESSDVSFTYFPIHNKVFEVSGAVALIYDYTDPDHSLKYPRNFPGLEMMRCPDGIVTYNYTSGDASGDTYVFTANEGGGYYFAFWMYEDGEWQWITEESDTIKIEELPELATLGIELGLSNDTKIVKPLQQGSNIFGSDLSKIVMTGSRDVTGFRFDNLNNTLTETGSTGDQIDILMYYQLQQPDPPSGVGSEGVTRLLKKGAEPAGVAVGRVGEKVVLFVCLERTDTIMAFDVSNPTVNTYPFIPNYSFHVPNDDDTLDYLKPEGIKFLDAEFAAGGYPQVIVSFENGSFVYVKDIVPVKDVVTKII